MTPREQLERVYREVCGDGHAYVLSESELADEIIARWREARHDKAQRDVDAAADELRTLWGGAK